MTYSITLNGNSSELSCDIFPPLEMGPDSHVCLLSLQTNNSIPNVEPGCNTIGFCDSSIDGGQTRIVSIRTGSYELSALESAIQKSLPDYVKYFQLSPDNNTLKCLMTSSHHVDFTTKNNISGLLGFEEKVYTAGVTHESERLVNIMKVNCIKVWCNLISGSITDGVPKQIIHEFYPTVPSGYRIIEVPRHPVYYPLNTVTVTRVSTILKDQKDNVINLRGEPITIRLHIRRHGPQI